MNERIKELAEQAGLMCTEDVNADGSAGLLLWFKKFDLERFAELIRLDETKACAEHYLGIMRDAVEAARLEERELCAKLCTEMGNGQTNQSLLDPWDCAAAIRQRGEK